MLQGQDVDPPHSVTPRSVGSAIRQLRLERGLSQEELAYRSGLDRSYTGGVERADRNPSLRILIQIADGLDLPLSTIMARAEAMARGEGGSGPTR